MSKHGSNRELFSHENDALTVRPQLYFFQIDVLVDSILIEEIMYHLSCSKSVIPHRSTNLALISYTLFFYKQRYFSFAAA